MLPEVKNLLVTPFINHVWSKLDCEYTTQHIITPTFLDTSLLEQLSEEGKTEINSMRIIQEPMHIDDLENQKVYVRLVIGIKQSLACYPHRTMISPLSV